MSSSFSQSIRFVIVNIIAVSSNFVHGNQIRVDIQITVVRCRGLNLGPSISTQTVSTTNVLDGTICIKG
ncbi:unnamed protein product [Rhizophagus irregularis]|nr:unnamed protein product [Rhizophagus irregularis]